MTGVLPAGVLFSAWATSCLRGEVSPDQYSDAVRGEDPRHLLVGLSPEPLTLVGALPILRTASRIQSAVPAPGDPVGLGGPAEFNAEALEAGSAVLLAGLLDGQGLGLVPVEDARTIVWTAMPARVPAPLDPNETDRDLRRILTLAATELADSGVSSWQPEIPDLLMNLDRREALPLPPSYAGRRAACIDRAVLCLEIVDLAPHHPALADLGRAARRALVAATSDSLGPS